MKHFGHTQYAPCGEQCEHFIIAPQNNPDWTLAKFRAAIAELIEGANDERRAAVQE
jgi:hypothetical protein